MRLLLIDDLLMFVADAWNDFAGPELSQALASPQASTPFPADAEAAGPDTGRFRLKPPCPTEAAGMVCAYPNCEKTFSHGEDE